MSELNFHVRHEVTPERVWGVFVAVAEGQPYDHIIQADRQVKRLRQLNLLEMSKPQLTETGVQLYQLGQKNRSIAFDLMHFYHYVLWKKNEPLVNGFAWSYRTHCNLLFGRSPIELDLATRETLTIELNNAISKYFDSQIHQTRKGSVSLSTNSLTGIQHWLTALEPSVLIGDFFACRPVCSSELLLAAIGSVVQSSNQSPSADILLSTENRLAICRICLLQPDMLDRALDWACVVFPHLIQPGTRTGSYGRFIRLQKIPVLSDFVPEGER